MNSWLREEAAREQCGPVDKLVSSTATTAVRDDVTARDEWIVSGCRARDDRERAYFQNRSGRWWYREYRRAGVAA